MRPRILIVDDHEGFRAAARTLLEADGFDVVGEATAGDSALRATIQLAPEIVLLDVHLPDTDGFLLSERLAALAPAPRVVLVSSRPITDLRRRVAASPVVGFLPKHELSGAALGTLLG